MSPRFDLAAPSSRDMISGRHAPLLRRHQASPTRLDGSSRNAVPPWMVSSFRFGWFTVSHTKQQGSIQQAKWEDAISRTTTQATVARSGQTEAAVSSSCSRSPGVPLLLFPDSALPSRPVDRINSGVGLCSESFFQNYETDLLVSIWMVFHSLLSGWVTLSRRQTAGVHTTSKVGGCISPSTTQRCRRDSVHRGKGAQHHQRVRRPAHVRCTSAAKGA